VPVVFNKFSVKLKNTIVVAQSEAHRLSCETVSPGHVLLALTQANDEIGLILHQQGVNPEVVRQMLPAGSCSDERAIVDIEFSSEARVLMKVASDFSDSDRLKEVTNAHVLKALLLEHAICSGVGMLQSLNVDLEALHRRTVIILKLTQRPEEPHAPRVPDTALEASSSGDESATNQSTLSVADVFDDASVWVIETARNNARALGHSSIRLDHLLSAFVKLGFWRDYVIEIISLVSDEYLLSLYPITAGISENTFLDFSLETKSLLIAAGELRKISSRELIEPIMLLQAMTKQYSCYDLFKNADHDKVWQLSERMRRDVIDEIEKREIALIDGVTSNFPQPAPDREHSEQGATSLMLTERLIRVLRFAKAEAVESRQPLVAASHIVLAMIRESFFSEIAFVADRQLDVEKLRAEISREHSILAVQIGLVDPPSVIRLSPKSRGLLLLARDKAHELRVNYIDLNHLAISLLATENWLRDLITSCTSTTTFALIKRLQQCSLQQHHALLGPRTTDSSSIGLPMSLDEVDEQLEPWPPPGKPSAEKSIEDRLNRRSEIVLGYAVHEARKLGHSQISIETIMLGLLSETFGPTFDVFSTLGLNLLDSREILASCCDRISERAAAMRPLSRNALRLMERAWRFAQLMKSNRIEPEHILLAIAEESEGIASFVCEALKIDGNILRAELISAMSASKKGGVPHPAD
jgi:ATP-dependent Clp protease ATP-binding subunit ClpA